MFYVGADAVQLIDASRKKYDAGLRCTSGDRYVTSDPIGLEGGLNTFGYVLGNPLIYSDPNGLNPAAGCAVGAFGGPIGCGIGALAGTVILVAAAGTLSGDVPKEDLGETQCIDDEETECNMKFVMEVYWGGPTKTCRYQSEVLFTFPQDADLPCMPVDKKRCLVDTSFMGPKARGIYGR